MSRSFSADDLLGERLNLRGRPFDPEGLVTKSVDEELARSRSDQRTGRAHLATGLVLEGNKELAFFSIQRQPTVLILVVAQARSGFEAHRGAGKLNHRPRGSRANPLVGGEVVPTGGEGTAQHMSVLTCRS
jgi:hypothetical protein